MSVECQADGDVSKSTQCTRRKPPSLAETEGQTDNIQNDSRILTFHVQIDVLQAMLFLVALATRMQALEQPRAIVFDEMFFGHYASLYLKRTFFFDTQPPLGKMMFAMIGYLAGWDGQFKFDKIGSVYPESVPVWYLRCVPAVMGSLVVPLAYQILWEAGFMQTTAAIGGLLVLLDVALLTQSRFMLLEAPLLLLIAVTLLSYLRLRKLSHRPFTLPWFLWLWTLAVSLALAISVKYSAAFTWVLILVLSGRDMWAILPQPATTNTQLLGHVLCRGLALIVIPIATYLAVFYVHLAVLNKAGPHDDVMTSAFQASLEGGLSAITKGQPLQVAYGSQVTLRRTLGPQPCWLHSHPHVYPVTYDSGRGSSHQQQVTCYNFKDVNNWWIVKDPSRNSLSVDEPLRPVRHGDLIQLVHGMTSRALNSHDVAAPVSPQHQEVTCYIDYNISFPTQNLWRLEIVNRQEEGAVWKTIESHVRLVHVNTSQAIKTSGRQLPDWGFQQLEVVTDKVYQQESTVWNVEEHRYTQSNDETARGRELSQAQMIPLRPVELGFFTKFWELQVKMLTVDKDVAPDHRYSSGPAEWPLGDSTIAYWYDPSTRCQVHLVGNPVLWYGGTCAVLLYSALLTLYLLRRQRHCHDVTQAEWGRFTDAGSIFLGGYLLHYVPYWLTDRPLFLHHYLPALYHQLLLLAALAEHLHHVIGWTAGRRLYTLAAAGALAGAAHLFLALRGLSFGAKSLSADDIQRLRWKESWDLIVQPNMR